MTTEDYPVLIRLDDFDLASFVATHNGWACEVVDVGLIPMEVAALCRFLEKRYGKPAGSEE